MDDARLASPETAEEPAAAAPGIGETLRAARKERGVTLEEASELLRIETRFLAALEDERFDAISAPVFVKGYLKLYCELLGLDPRPLLDALSERISGHEPEPIGRRPVEDEEKSAVLLPVVIAALVVAVGAIVWWQLDADSVAQRVTRDSTAELGGESGRASGPESALPAFENASPAPPAASYRLVSGSEPIAGTAEGEESTAPVAGAAEGDASPEPIAETADEVSSSETASNDGEATPVTGQSDMAAALEIELRFDQD